MDEFGDDDYLDEILQEELLRPAQHTAAASFVPFAGWLGHPPSRNVVLQTTIECGTLSGSFGQYEGYGPQVVRMHIAVVVENLTG